VVVVEESRHLGVDDEADGAALATVAAVGAGEGLELFAANRHAAIAAVARAQVQTYLIDERCHECSFVPVPLCRPAWRLRSGHVRQ